MLLLLTTSALAEDYTLMLSDAEVAILGDALGAQPYNKVAPLVAKLQKQIQEATAAKQKEGAAKSDDKQQSVSK